MRLIEEWSAKLLRLAAFAFLAIGWWCSSTANALEHRSCARWRLKLPGHPFAASSRRVLAAPFSQLRRDPGGVMRGEYDR